jgi:hypothetical protein
MASNSFNKLASLSSANGDVPGDTSTTYTLAVEAPVLGSIDVGGDEDWYRFEAKSGKTYLFDLEGNSSGAGTLSNPNLRLLDSAGNEIASNDDAWWAGTNNSQISFSPGADGVFYVSAQTADGGTGTYRLSATEVAGDVPSSTATQTKLTVDAPVAGNIDFAFDQDWYWFEVKSGKTYVFDLEGSATGAGTWGNPYLRLLDAEGNEITSNDDAGSPNSQTGYSADADGVVFVAPGWPSWGWDAGTGTYRLSARMVVGDLPGSDATTAKLSLDVPVAGNIDFANDQDWYRFEVKSGETYVLNLDGSAGGIGTLNNPYLRVLDSAGNEIASNDDFGTRNSQIGYSAAADGFVYVSAQTADGGTGTYRLSAHQVAGDVPESAATKAEFTVGTSVSGNIDFGQDADWYRFDAKAGTTYLFDLEGSASGNGTLGNPYLRVLDSNGNEIASNDDEWWVWTPNSQVGFSPGADGLFYVSAQTADGGTGSYRLSASEVVGDLPSSPATQAELTVDAAVSGNIDFAFDQDWFRFEVKGGSTYVFDLQGSATGAGTWGNPYLRLLDSAGNEIASNDDSGSPNSQIGYSAGADDVVYVTAGWPSWGWDAGTGTYRLSAREVAADVPDNSATALELAVAAPLSGTIDFAFDQDWYRFEVKSGSTYTFDLEGSATNAGTWGNPYLRLLDANGNEIASNDDAWYDTPNSQIAYSAPADDVVYVAAGWPSWGWDAGTGTYRLSAREIVGDVSDSTASMAALAIGGSVKGVTDYVGDHDWYQVEVQAGRTYAFDLQTADGNGAVVNPYLVLRDANGNEIRSDDNGGNGSNAQLGYSATADGVVYVDATSADSSTGSYKLSAREVPHDQPDNDTTTASLKVGQKTHAAIDFANDGDCFKAPVKAGHTYVVDVEGSATLAGSLGDPRVIVSDKIGPDYENFLEMWYGGDWNDLPASASLGAFVVEAETPPDDAGDWSQWTAASGGNDHYYRIMSSPSGTNWQTANDLAVAAGFHLATIASAGENSFVQQLVASASVYDAWLGGLQPNPTPEEEPAGGWAWVTDETFDFANWSGGQPDNAQGGGFPPLVENDDGGVGANAQAGFTAIQDGALYVRVSADDAETGTYTMKLREIVGDIASNASTSKDLALGKQACSTVDFANDQDWFRVQVEAGQTYVFEANGAATGSGKLDDPSLRLVDPFGSELANGSDGGVGLNDRNVYTADANRTLYLAVGGANEDAQGSYKVTASKDDGGWFIDLPHLKNGQAMPEAAIQASSNDAPGASGELYLTWIGGKSAYSDAIGVVRVEDGNVLDPQLVFSASKSLSVGDSASLGTVGSGDRIGLFMIANAAKTVPHLGQIGADDLLLRNPDSGDLARSSDGVAPELLRLDGSQPALVDADVLFAMDDDPYSPLYNPLNPEGSVQATVGDFYRNGEDVCRLVAFEETPYAGVRPDRDFNDAVFAFSVKPLSQTDIAVIHDYLLG